MAPERPLPHQGASKIKAVKPVFFHCAELGPEGGRREQAERPGDHKGKDIAPTETPENVNEYGGLPEPLNDQQAKADPGQPPGAQGPQHPVLGPEWGPCHEQAAMQAEPETQAGKSPEGDDREGDGRQRPRRIRSSRGSTRTLGQWTQRCAEAAWTVT